MQHRHLRKLKKTWSKKVRSSRIIQKAELLCLKFLSQFLRPKKESAWTPPIRPDHSGLFYSIHSYDRVTSGVRKREV